MLLTTEDIWNEWEKKLDESELSKPEFSEIMLNNNNNNNNNIDDTLKQYHDQQQLSPIYNDSMYKYDDYLIMESIDDIYCKTPSSPIDSIFSPTIKSPLGGFVSSTDGTAEESFTFETLPDGNLLPIKYSQEYDDNLSFTEEIDTVAQLTEFDQQFSTTNNQTTIKEEKDTSSLNNDLILYHDYMITGSAPICVNDQQETQIQTVEHYSDILIKNENDKLSSKQQIIIEDYTNSNDSFGNNSLESNQNQNLNFLTPSPSPHRLYNNNNREIIIQKELSSVPKHIDHTYIVVPPTEISTCKRKLVLEPITITDNNNTINMKHHIDSRINRKRIEGKRPIRPKIQIPIHQMDRKRRSIGGGPIIEISTPEITADILKMEDEKFDLIKYITSPLDTKQNPMTPSKEQKPTIIQTNTQNKTTDLAKWLDDIVKTNKQRRPSIEEPYSVQTNFSANYSDDGSSTTDTIMPAKKRRGRPPKQSCSMPTPSQLSQMDEKDIRYQEMRYKNNEASRRSRLNRKEKEDCAMSECNDLEEKYQILSIQERRLMRDCEKMRAAVMKLAQM